MRGMDGIYSSVPTASKVVYCVGVMTTMAFGRECRVDAIAEEKLFATVPASMFTSFRCFTAECVPIMMSFPIATLSVTPAAQMWKGG